jgi:thiamine pyrophosphokinase
MKKIKSVLIIANGAGESKAFLKKQAAVHDFILALDAGADTALKAGVTPDLAIGDLDSISQTAKKKLGKAKLFKITRQDNTDFEKGLDFISFIKPEKVTIACATGGRIDFTLSNFSSVFNYAGRFDMVFKSESWRIYPVIETKSFNCKKGAAVSLIPMDACKDITLRNLKYTLKNATLAPGRTAVSNTAKKDAFTVSFRKGKLLVMIYG